jgi:hypothetical protein
LKLSSADQPDGWDSQTFLEDVRVAAVAEISVMGKRGGPGSENSVNENWRSEDDVGQMGSAAAEGVIADECVPVSDLFGWVPVQDGVDDAHQRTEMERGATFVLGDAPALSVEEAGGAVPTFFDVGGVRGPDECAAHFFNHGG